MKTKIFILSVLMCGFFSSQAQKELSDSQFRGKIMLKNGDAKEGIIEFRGDADSPWSKQVKIFYITEEIFKKEKIKNKEIEKFTPKDLKGFYVGQRYFEVVKYADLSAVGAAMMPKMYFLEKFVDGKISIYRFYRSPGNVTIAMGEEEIAEAERFEEECRTNPDLLIRLDDGKLKNVSDIDIYKYISECENVVSKYKAGEYGLKPTDKDNKKGVGKFASRLLDASVLEKSVVQIANDFNSCE